MKKILIVDDDAAVTNYFLVFLTQTERFETAIVNDSRQVPDLLDRERFDVILLDMDMPDVSGTDILKLVGERGIRTPVVVLTGVGDVALSVNAMKLGAFDYLTKPVEDDHLLSVLDAAVEQGAIHSTINGLPPELRREDLEHPAAFEGFVSQDDRMVRLLHQADRMASGDATVFIIGERGSGRERLARAIHDASARRDRPFAVLDPASLDRDELRAALFGRARGWGGAAGERRGLLEDAAGGTLYIGDVERLGIRVQMRLKRVIQTKEYCRENSTQHLTADVRLIVSSTEDLTSPEYRGAFSRDLLYHLMANTLRIPPLRERPGDIRLLAEAALGMAARPGPAIRAISEEALDVLARYPFPCNDAELASIIEGAAMREETDVLMPGSLPEHVLEGRPPATEGGGGDFEPRRLADVERDHVARMVLYCKGDREKAAAELGIPVERVAEILGAADAASEGDG